MPNQATDPPVAVNIVARRLRAVAWRLPALGGAGGPARVYEVRKAAPGVLDVVETGERYRLCRRYLAKIENRDSETIGHVRLGVETSSRRAYAFKEIGRIDAATRALAHLRDEQALGVQADSDVAGRTLLRSASREYLVLPLMAGDLTCLQQARGRGKTAAMLLGMRAVLADLQRCHDKGVAHRDIKPANILHRGTPQSVRLCDFGLARSVAQASQGTGTPQHMAPEQHWARMRKIAGHPPIPADVWGVGATFLDIWVGNPFWCADAAERTRMHTAYAQWHARAAASWCWPVDGADALRFAWAFGRLPRAVCPLMLRLLHPNPRKRPSVSEARAAVEALLKQTPDMAYAAGHYQKAAQDMCDSWDLTTRS